jgi:hypothetical protein
VVPGQVREPGAAERSGFGSVEEVFGAGKHPFGRSGVAGSGVAEGLTGSEARDDFGRCEAAGRPGCGLGQFDAFATGAVARRPDLEVLARLGAIRRELRARQSVHQRAGTPPLVNNPGRCPIN